MERPAGAPALLFSTERHWLYNVMGFVGNSPGGLEGCSPPQGAPKAEKFGVRVGQNETGMSRLDPSYEAPKLVLIVIAYAAAPPVSP